MTNEQLETLRQKAIREAGFAIREQHAAEVFGVPNTPFSTKKDVSITAESWYRMAKECLLVLEDYGWRHDYEAALVGAIKRQRGQK